MNGYALALAAALFYGLTPPLGRLGLLGGITPLAGTVVSTATAAVLYYAISAWTWKRLVWPRVDRYSLFFIVVAGLTHTLGALFQYMALEVEYVSLVTPLVNLGPVVTVGALLLVRVEKVDWDVIVGTLLVVIGAALVVTR